MSKNATVKCPNCKEVFKVDDSVYTNIVKQVRDQQFQEEVSNRLAIAENEKKSAMADLKNQVASLSVEIAEKVIKGGAGVWGAIPMPAQNQLSTADSQALVKWILTTH